MLDSTISLHFILFNPGWMFGITQSKEAGSVDIGDSKSMRLQSRFDTADLIVPHLRRKGMGGIGYNFYPLISKSIQNRNRFDK
jgi:hypothetical protein